MAELEIGGTTNEPPPTVAPAEVLPSERELELEVLLKERDEHLTRLANEVRLLRRRLPVSDKAPTDDPFALPPAVTNLLLPLLSKNSFSNNLTGVSGQALSGPASATVTAALTARLAALHQENEELYELLKRGAVGRLREEVRELRVTARRLEGALQESHTIISQLKTELEESYRAIERLGESSRTSGRRHSRSHSPINHYKQKPQSFATRPQSDAKPIPTGPRALKKPRLSDPSLEHPSSGYRSNGRSTPPVPIKKEEDSRMKVEDDDYGTYGAGGRDDDQYSDYYRPKSEQHSHYSRSRSPTPKRLGSEGSDWDRPKSRSRSRSRAMDDRSPSAQRSASPRRSQGRRQSYSSEQPQRSPSRSPVARSRSRSVDRPARSPTPPSPDMDETRTPTRSYSRTRSSVHSPVSRRRSLSRTKSSPRSSRRYSRSPPRQRRSPTPSRSPPRRSRSPSRLRIHGAARRLEDRGERSLRPASPTRNRGGDRRPDTRAERERERGHRDSKGRTNDREKDHRGGNSDAFGNGRRRRQGKGSQKHGSGGGGGGGSSSGTHVTRNGSNPSLGVGSLASRIQ